ncbi:MAG: serine protein kinase PrkA [Methylotenera sp.]|nr:serine protein kinase PrkA [Oligoflexia bacterium]
MSKQSPDTLRWVEQAVKTEFESNRRLLSFDEYLELVAEQPECQLRGSAQYAADMMDYFGKEESTGADKGEPHARFKIFDETELARKVIGHEEVQNKIYNTLRTFARQGINNKLVLLHGPNGSAKSTLIQGMMAGMEKYSHEPKGGLYTFNWVFPLERYTKGGLGLGAYSERQSTNLSTYAKLPDEEVAARLPSVMRDHPFLLIPQAQRRALLEKLLGRKKCDELWETLPQYLTKGDLNHRCKEIFNALVNANGGDFRKVLMHVQVERYYFARRFRKGLVTIEPQMHVDAQYHQLSYNKSLSSLPVSLQSLNLFTLTGDLVDGNRGIIEYSDLLKRPIETYKYLLIACETGSVNVGASIAYLDTCLLGSSNELQLDAFKEFPDFTSFKARIELIRVPYLLSVSQEKEIYHAELKQVEAEKHVTPHTDWALALWAVLTRLKKPNGISYPNQISSVISNLSPLEKAKLYDTGEMPMGLSPEDRKILRSSIRKLREEYSNIPYYEGRMGASAREIKSILFGAAQNAGFACLSPLAVLREMEDFVKHTSEYEFLKQDIKDGYHDSADFINTVRNEYLTVIDREVRDSIGLYNSVQWEDFLKKYVQHIALVLKKEKVKNSITGKMEDPDFALINEFEKIVGAPTDAAEQIAFRQNIISQVGAWSLDHPREGVSYAKVFPEFWHKLEKHYYESQKSRLTQMHDALLFYGRGGSEQEKKESGKMNEEGDALAHQTIENMKSKLGYCENCAKEVITFLMKSRY